MEASAKAPETEQVTDDLTPRMIVQALDRHIVGQAEAKKMVAIALRNRSRRQKLDPGMREEVSPKNIIMIGPTGVGKTEIARRLARLTRAPFIKVEATKYTEVGYVGRDVESMVRDLVETSIKLVREEHVALHRESARKQARERLIELLSRSRPSGGAHRTQFVAGFGAEGVAKVESEPLPEVLSRQEIARKLDRGELDDRMVEIDVQVRNNLDGMIGMMGVDEQSLAGLREMMDRMTPRRSRTAKMKAADARKVLMDQAIEEMLDMDQVAREGIDRAEQTGIIFIDEIDKIAGRDGAQGGPDVSRQGVQRDILPIIEGCTVTTKHGQVKTDHILFFAAGAFHIAKPSDLIPELQGRFPLRVELDSLSAEDFERILTEPQPSLIDQYKALLETEGVLLHFSEEAIKEIATASFRINQSTEDIGARRLYTVLERVLQDVSFDAPDAVRGEVNIDRAYVQSKLTDLMEDQDLSRFIL